MSKALSARSLGEKRTAASERCEIVQENSSATGIAEAAL